VSLEFDVSDDHSVASFTEEHNSTKASGSLEHELSPSKRSSRERQQLDTIVQLDRCFDRGSAASLDKAPPSKSWLNAFSPGKKSRKRSVS
jgi:hypothetical protein